VISGGDHSNTLCPQVYQDLCVKHPTFRERSERVDLSVSGRMADRNVSDVISRLSGGNGGMNTVVLSQCGSQCDTEVQLSRKA